MKFLTLALALFLSATAAFAEDPSTFSVGGFDFTRPADWQWVPVTSPMRKAQLKVPGSDPAQSAEITFFHFGAEQGGDVTANAQRWFRQFESKPDAEKIEPQEIGGTKVTFVSTEGTYHSGMPGGPTTALNNYALLGAIVQGSEGSVFIKMTGPADLVKSSRQKFVDFVAGAAKSKK